MTQREHENAGKTTIHNLIRNAVLQKVSPNMRAKRMGEFEQMMGLREGMSVLDLGGTTRLWKHIRTPLHVTILNRDTQPIDETQYGHHHFTIVRGDATRVDYPDQSFDLVFSNSVIEHVGDSAKQKAFAVDFH